MQNDSGSLESTDPAMIGMSRPALENQAVSLGAPQETEKPYSVYSTKEKWFIVALIAFAGLFSPLTANIYLPAIPVLTVDFNKSTELINITVTVYMVFQGLCELSLQSSILMTEGPKFLAPMLFGTMADQVGRRPMFAGCLLILSLSCIGLALVPTSAYWLLVVLRCAQAAGSASTIALGAGTIGDIAAPVERGGFYGLYNLGPMFGPCIGPVIGGALSNGLGWRSIFWFLCISSAACFVVIVLFLPETLRSLVGDGSAIPSKHYRPLIPVVGKTASDPSFARPPPKPFRNPLRILNNLDIMMVLSINAVINSLYYGVTASMSTLFSEAYPSLNQTQIGLCYLAIGGGMVIGSSVLGRVLDQEYGRLQRSVVAVQAPGNTEKSETGIDDNFPIEKARLRLVPFSMLIFAACCAGYGWSVQEHTNLAGPLLLQVAIGFTTMGIMTSTQTLLVDLMPSQSSSVTACNNFIRCIAGAVLVSTMDLLLRALGAGWTYVLLGGICMLTIPLVYLIIHFGPPRRIKRRRALATIN
ncbi:MFS general substrate transporter [Desarmillaria tabescens]|uniref:MFS general substrate transporter n=1 Tax=Armillaria tabescens TaxID=1929756 RepID=A0AA39NIV4_ARMTA|nr:MFS general substrate transporter [Desarmillaria tabescens]KAK0466462.1 MFS general substrate transporter [Desarmillaria tabescens]